VLRNPDSLEPLLTYRVCRTAKAKEHDTASSFVAQLCFSYHGLQWLVPPCRICNSCSVAKGPHECVHLSTPRSVLLLSTDFRDSMHECNVPCHTHGVHLCPPFVRASGALSKRGTHLPIFLPTNGRLALLWHPPLSCSFPPQVWNATLQRAVILLVFFLPPQSCSVCHRPHSP
jgi:hypothetical protein